ALAALAFYNARWVFPGGTDAVVLAAIAVTGLAGQVFMTRSYFYLSAAVASGLSTLALFFGMLWDMVFHHEYPTPEAWFGYFVLVVGVYILQARPRPKPVLRKQELLVS